MKNTDPAIAHNEPHPVSQTDASSYANYICGIDFRLFQPLRRPWPFYRPRYLPPFNILNSQRLTSLLRRLDLSLEIHNTRLPCDAAATRQRLRPLCYIPRMSTYAIASMINRAVAQMPTQHCFVNVGVWHGFSLLAGMAGNPEKVCIGVDDFSEFGGPHEAFAERLERLGTDKHSFFDMSYQDYFANVHKDPIGVYMYDGEHSYENQLQGMRAAEPFFANDCLILADDTNLPAPRVALFDFINQSRNHYRVLLDRRTRANLHPTLWNGLIVVQRVG